MENTTPQEQPQPEQPRPPRRSRRGMVIVILVVAALALIALALRSFWLAEPVAIDTEHPLDLPVVEPDANSMDDIAALMENKALPPEFPGMILPPFNEDDHVRGDRFAPFSVVEYSNFGNKLASLLHPDLAAMAASSDVNWVVRHYPLVAAHNLPAQAAECAYFQGGDHGKFWAYYDAGFMMANPTVDSLVSLAQSQGLDAAAFRTCLENDFTRDRVLRDAQDGTLDARVTISPSYVVVNNLTGELRLVEGVNTIGYIRDVVDSIR